MTGVVSNYERGGAGEAGAARSAFILETKNFVNYCYY
jgi:hypothetical protein